MTPARAASWDALRVFVAVHRAGSFSAAADELQLAQSSVSEQIARLERQLGHALLIRSPAGVRATDRGLELAARIAGPVDALAAVTNAESAGPRTVFLGGPAEFLSEVILPAIATTVPDRVRVVARFALAEDLLDELRAGSIDVLVSTVPVRGTDLSSAPLVDEEFALVGHPHWRERSGGGLNQIPLLAYGPDLPIVRRYWQTVFGRRPDGLDVRMIAPDLRSLLRLICDGAGMTVLPDYLVDEHLGNNDLVLLHEPELPPLNTLHVATRRGGAPDPAISAVRTAVVEAAR